MTRPDGERTDQDVADVVRREMLLLTTELRTSPEGVRALLHPDFVEFGASGRVWDRATVAEALRTAEPVEILAQDVVPIRLADDVILVTYRTGTAGDAALRSSVWTRSDRGDWLMRFHQGTRTGRSG